MRGWILPAVFCLQWVIPSLGQFAMPKLPGLYSPELCLPMTDHSYPNDPNGDLSQEVIIANWNQETLFCKRGCCGDSKEAMCCAAEEDEGMTVFELVSVVAAGIAGITVITVTSLYLIKKHNKHKILVHDINNINKMNKKGNKDVEAGKASSKVGQYQKSPDFKDAQSQGKLFKKTKTPAEMKHPKAPISILSPPEILPIIGGPPINKPSPLGLPPLTNKQAPNQPTVGAPHARPDALIANLKAPSPPIATTKPSALAPSPPLPENLPPPLISPPSFRTAEVDDDFIDSILASIPLEDTEPTYK